LIWSSVVAHRLDIYAHKEDIYVVHNRYISMQRDTGIAGDCIESSATVQ
jgi:hypothetical protein